MTQESTVSHNRVNNRVSIANGCDGIRLMRSKRSDEAGGIYHALNRGNDRKGISKKLEGYDAFIRILEEGLQKYAVELFSVNLMPNHWHFVLRRRKDGQMGRLLRWVSALTTCVTMGATSVTGTGTLTRRG